MSLKLEGRTAIVIGGNGGIGGAIAERFALEGATVYATSRHSDEGEIPFGSGCVKGRLVNASDKEAVAAFFHAVRSEVGELDILVVNAGISEFAQLGAIDDGHFERSFGLNVRAMVFAVQSGIEMMPAGAAIVLVGSIASSLGTNGYGVYGATKAAVRSFARTWAKELAPRGIRVNVVAPGPTDTAMMAATSDEIRNALTASIPLGRMGHADEIAAAAFFLASKESSYVTGIELPVDGGLAQV